MKANPRHDEIEQYKSDQRSAEPKDESTVYEEGNVLPISIYELKDNEVAIRQLLNANNIAQRKLRTRDIEISDLKSEIEFLRTSPFVSILTLFTTTIAAIVMGVGINLVTGEHNQETGKLLSIIGGVLTILGGLANILYPFARLFFGKRRKNGV